MDGRLGEEMDAAALRRSLSELGREVEAAQARVIATIETKHAEFVAASEQVNDLRGTVQSLQGDLRGAARLLGQGGDVPAGHVPAESSPVPRLHAAVAEHAALSAELEALETAAQVMKTMLGVNRQLGDLDGLIGEARYCDAAELTLVIAQALQSISGPETSTEPAMVKAAKVQYYQRRAILVGCLEDALNQLVSFGDCCTAGRRSAHGPLAKEGHAAAPKSPTTLPQVWEALRILDLRRRRVEQLAEQGQKAVLLPLLEAARRLRPGCELEPRLSSDDKEGEATWTWVSTKDDRRGAENAPEGDALAHGARQGAWRPPVQAVLPALESFFAFVLEHWAGGEGDVYGSLGKRLWPQVTRCLVQHLETFYGDGGEALEGFEGGMLARGLIGEKDKALSRYVHAHRHALGEQRRTLTLGEARDWLMKEEPTLVAVCDTDGSGAVAQPAQQAKQVPKSAGSGSGAAPQSDSDFFHAKIRHALRDAEGLFRLPGMSVSASVHKLATRLRGLMEELVEAAGQGREEVAHDINRLVRELCTLFAVLRPYVQKSQLKTSPACCGVFLADCLYLVHVLALMPYTYGKRLPPDSERLAIFVDLVPQLRRLGESHFSAMLRHQQEQLVAALWPCDLAVGISWDQRLNAAEAALGEAVRQVKAAAQGLAATLPAQLLCEVTGLLLSTLCEDLLGKLFALQHTAPEEVDCLASFLASSLAMARQVFAVADLDEETLVPDISGWAALALVAELLGRDLSGFLENRVALVAALTKEEAMKLMQLSWHDEQISTEEAWTVLSQEE